jgi:xanthine/uracil permease
MDEAERDIGWLRGIATGVVVLVVGLGLAVMGSDEIINRFTGLSRNNVSYLASAFFLLCVGAAAWVLRRLQARGLL